MLITDAEGMTELGDHHFTISNKMMDISTHHLVNIHGEIYNRRSRLKNS